MADYLVKIVIYIICFILAAYALSALDINRMLKKNAVYQAQLLYLMMAMALSYLVGSLVIALMLHFN
ncbi:MAG: DUF1146 domain-containing protein [Erysipelotrichaceae bacterium]|nr:DUF1146 domain-containing protein [Erysipelotrichaceae bacterium]